MCMASDGSAISEAAICRLAGVRRQTRGVWAKKGLLRKRPKDQYGLLDLLELTACKVLIAGLGSSDGPAAWRQTRDDLVARVPSPGIEVVFCGANHQATVVTTDSALCGIARQGLPVTVVPVGGELCRARAAFDRYHADRLADGGAPPANLSDAAEARG